MTVSVGINAKNKKDFIAQLLRARKNLPKGTSLHIDVSDRGFSNIKSYFDVGELKKYSGYFKFEAHLMVPRESLFKYFKKPLKKAWVHISEIKNWESILAKAKKSKISLGVAIGINELKYKDGIPKNIGSILVLAVKPGPSGQKFGKKSLNLISFLSKKYPYAKIYVDGGITLKTAERVKGLGVRNVVSTSYIWGAKNPANQYRILRKI